MFVVISPTLQPSLPNIVIPPPLASEARNRRAAIDAITEPHQAALVDQLAQGAQHLTCVGFWRDIAIIVADCATQDAL